MATRAAELGRPVLVIVDADPGARKQAVSALARRFGPDYQVLPAGTAQDGLDALRGLADRGDQVALVAADLRLPGIGGVEFLQWARALQPGATAAGDAVAMATKHRAAEFTRTSNQACTRRWPGQTALFP